MAKIFRNLNRNFYTGGNTFSNTFQPKQLQNCKAWYDATSFLPVEIFLTPLLINGGNWTNACSPSLDGYADPFGGNNAFYVNDNVTNNYLAFSQARTIPDGYHVYTVSIYVKKIPGADHIFACNINLSGGVGVNGGIRLNPDTGAFTNGGTLNNTVTDTGTGWWHITMPTANNNTGNTSINVLFYPASGVLPGSLGADTIVAIGSQIIAYPSLITGSVPYWQNRAALSNYADYSQSLSNWTEGGSTVADNDSGTLAPDGTQTASLYAETTDNSVHVTNRAISGITNALGKMPYTYSMYVKKDTIRYMLLRVGTTVGYQADFDLQTATVTSVAQEGACTAGVEVCDNSWRRLWMTFYPNENAVITVQVASSNAPTGYNSYVGSTSNRMWIWGAQFTRTPGLAPYVATGASNIVSNDSSQTTAANQPWLIPSGNTITPGVASSNDIPTIRGSATSRLTVPDIGISGAATFSAVFSPSGTANTYIWSGAAGGEGFIHKFDASKLEWFNGADRYLLNTNPAAGLHIATVKQTNGAELKGYYDGYNAFSQTATAIAQTPDSAPGYISATNGLSGDLSEFVIYSTNLATINRRRLERYLSKKYAITLTATD